MNLFEMEKRAAAELEKIEQELQELFAKTDETRSRKFFWQDVQATAQRARELEAAAEKSAGAIFVARN